MGIFVQDEDVCCEMTMAGEHRILGTSDGGMADGGTADKMRATNGSTRGKEDGKRKSQQADGFSNQKQ